MNSNSSKATLYYIHDPMCSWCWGFRPVWQQVLEKLPKQIKVQYVLGGLAPDSDAAMPQDMQLSIAATWQMIQKEIPGTQFNFDFWNHCLPRRSTYPACRAVIAATKQNPAAETEMLLAIQQAYYLRAENPSDYPTLIDLAEPIGLDKEQFASDILSDEVEQILQQNIKLAHSMYVYSFPSLILERNGQQEAIKIDYNDADKILQQIF
ncbi:MAG: DsbA family protein [Gammaproteobacteria bacterium]